ncbi:ribonuclease HI family protein [bacterium]|nr:ribonuclease HI family protein [bacterium]
MTIKCDGGSRSNPGPAASAFAVWQGTDLIYRQGLFLGIATNNQAEYKAVIASLQWLAAQDRLPDKVTWKLDSMLVVEQIIGNWKVKDYKLRFLRDKCRELLAEIFPDSSAYQFMYIPRAQNVVADALVNETLDLHVKK